MALGAFLKKDNTSFYQFMNDAAFLVDQSVDSITKIFHEMILGFVNFTEKIQPYMLLTTTKQENFLSKVKKPNFLKELISF